jgi:hypothetical protein
MGTFRKFVIISHFRRLEVLLLDLPGYGSETIVKVIFLIARPVKGEMAFKITPGFRAQIEDMHLECRMFVDDSKDKSSGRSPSLS